MVVPLPLNLLQKGLLSLDANGDYFLNFIMILHQFHIDLFK